MNPKCLGTTVPDTFSAKSADSTGLKMRRITRAVSLDRLVGEREQLVWHRKTERLGGLKIDCQLEFGGLHHRQVGGLLPFKNSSGIDARLAVGMGNGGRVAHQAASRDGLAHLIDRRNPMLGRQRNKPLPVGVRERAATDEQGVSSALHECCKGCLDIAVAFDVEDDELLL